VLLLGRKQMNQARAKKPFRKKTLYLPKVYEGIPEVPKVAGNVLLHGYPGGIRHEAVDIGLTLVRYGFRVEKYSFGYVVSGVDEEGYNTTYFGESLVDVLKQLKDEDENCRLLYHTVCRDPLDQTRLFVEDTNLDLTTEEYLFEVVSDEHREDQLTVGRVFRSLLGKSVDLVTKWTQSERFGDGYVAFKFPVVTNEDVYHVGAGSWFGQTFRGIQTTGKVRCTDPQRDGTLIEYDPPEMVCVSDCSYGDGFGLSNVEYFYAFYEKWIKSGKQVYFKGDLCRPPDFPCRIVGEHLSRPHNREFIGYADATMTTFPDYVAAREKMSQANVNRNLKASKGDVTWPQYDKERVEQLLCQNVGYRFKPPEVIDLERKVCGKARFPISREAFKWRCSVDMAASPFSGITNSVIVWLFEMLANFDDEDCAIDLLRYSYFENHQFVEECLWSFEECASRLGLVRKKSLLVGTLTNTNRKEFTRLVEKSAARH